MKAKSIIFFLALISFLGSSCTQVLDVDVPVEDDRIVIEGLVTDQTKPFTVKVSRTIGLGNTGDYPKVNDALVIIADNAGNRDTLDLVGSGVYQTDGPRTGVVGRTYYITVKVNGVTYDGHDKLHAVPAIDSLYTVFLNAGSLPGITDDGYYLFVNSTDPPQKNYYRNIVYKNDKFVLKPSEIAVYDDRFLGPVLIGIRLAGKYEVGDKAKLELYALSESAYNFYNGLATQLQSDGGFFSTPPANAVNNLSNGALGFFQASGITSDSLIVQP